MYNYLYEAVCVNFIETHWVRNYEIYKHWIVRIYQWKIWRHNFSKNASSQLLKGTVLSTEILAIILLWSRFLNFYFLFHQSLCNKQFGRNLKQVLLPTHSRYLTVFISSSRGTQISLILINAMTTWDMIHSNSAGGYENWWTLSKRYCNFKHVYLWPSIMLRK